MIPLLPAVPLPLQAVISMDSELVAVPVIVTDAGTRAHSGAAWNRSRSWIAIDVCPVNGSGNSGNRCAMCASTSFSMNAALGSVNE